MGLMTRSSKVAQPCRFDSSLSVLSSSMTAMFTRREFLEKTAVAGAVATLGKFVAPVFGQAADSIAASPSWIDKPMRWAQLTLVEDDPGKFDIGFWVSPASVLKIGS